MAVANKTQQSTALLALQNCAASSQVISGTAAVTTVIGASVLINFGRTVATAYTVSPTFRIEGQISGFPRWAVLAQFTPVLGASLTYTAVSAGGTAGTKTVTATSITNFAVQDIIYLKNGTIANGEFARIAGISGSVITAEDNFVNNQTTGNSTNIARGAEIYVAQLDLTSIVNMRLVVDNSANATASGVDVAAWYSTFDNFS